MKDYILSGACQSNIYIYMNARTKDFSGRAMPKALPAANLSNLYEIYEYFLYILKKPVVHWADFAPLC